MSSKKQCLIYPTSISVTDIAYRTCFVLDCLERAFSRWWSITSKILGTVYLSNMIQWRSHFPLAKMGWRWRFLLHSSMIHQLHLGPLGNLSLDCGIMKVCKLDEWNSLCDLWNHFAWLALFSPFYHPDTQTCIFALFIAILISVSSYNLPVCMLSSVFMKLNIVFLCSGGIILLKQL